jgi:alpha-beta hydrolase superfamily lysophospholipase
MTKPTAPPQEQKAKLSATPTLPAAFPLLSPALCGKGAYALSFGDQAIGRETFEVKCTTGGGYATSAHTSLTIPGAAVELDSTLEVDKAALPLKFTVKGTSNGAPVDQSIVFKDGIASVTRDGQTNQLPLPTQAAILVPNISYILQFAAARYDNARGGVQQIPIFPNVSAEMERTARDVVQATGNAATAKPMTFDRYRFDVGGANIVLWTDAQGRLAMMALPVQRFVGVRDDAARDEGFAYVEPFYVKALLGKLANKAQGALSGYDAPPNAAFTAEEVEIVVKGYKLAGTLLLPKTGRRPFPAAITITGSGQQTRDESLGISGLESYKPFRQIAETLASRGVAVLRVDDRGVGASTGTETLEAATTLDFADDVRAQVAYLRTRREIAPARIALIGHSEGGVIAPLVASTDERIAAIVLMAGTAKRGDEVLLYQLNRPFDNNPILPEAEKTARRAENEKMLRTVIEGGDTTSLPQLLRHTWTKAFLTYDPLPAIRKVRQPVLILQGALDRQVTADQATMLEQAAQSSGNKDVTTHVFPTLNHLFLPAKTGEPSEYSALETKVLGDDLLNVLGDWLQSKLKVSK